MPTHELTIDDLAGVARRTRYPLAAFLFVQRALDFAICREHGDFDAADDDADHESRHISGQQLCHGLRDFAIREYGLLARTVLRRWNIRCCEDFGQIVFAMVDAGLMHKTEGDSVADFEGVFDFADAFDAELSLTSTTT